MGESSSEGADKVAPVIMSRPSGAFGAQVLSKAVVYEPQFAQSFDK
jgi:hypothetical protein